MSSELKASDWLNIYKLGSSAKDRFLIFWFMVNAILVMAFLMKVYGIKNAFPIYLRHTWILNWTPGKNVMVSWNKMNFSIPLVLEGVALFKLGYEKQEQEFVDNVHLDNNSVVLDIGANMGLYTISTSKKYPTSKVIAIEASPTYFKNLKQNCELNNIDKVSLYNKAASNTNDETIEFYEGVFSTIEEEFLPDLGTPKDKIKKVKVETITIDSLFEKEKLDEITILKMDIEGAEVMALNGATSCLDQKKIKNMIIEYHTVENKNKIIELFKDKGYNVQDPDERDDYVENKNIENGHIIASIENLNFLKTN